MIYPSVQMFSDWLNSKGLSDRTIGNYILYYNKFKAYSGYNQEKVRSFMSIPNNVNSNARGFLMNFKKFLLENYRELQISYLEKLEISETQIPSVTGRRKQTIVNPISYSDVHILEKYLKDESDKIKLLVTYYCGLRLSEMLNIRLLDFKWDSWKSQDEQLDCIIRKAKGNKQRVVHLPATISVRIKNFVKNNKSKYSSSNPRIFVFKENVNMKSQFRMWRKKLSDAGIEAGFIKLDGDGHIIRDTSIHPHTLRHSFATYCLEHGLNMKEVQELLGHSSSQSTEIYLHVTDEHLKNKTRDLF